MRDRWPRLVAAALALVVAPWLYGLVCFAFADGHVEVTLPRTRTPPADVHDVAAWDLGPTVRASSYFAEWGAQHHPLFVVDRRENPSVAEKWASASGDRRPWIEVSWREPRNLERVVLRHAGTAEASDMTVRRYTVTCLLGGGPGASLSVPDNQDAVANHALACAGARGVRVDLLPNDADDIVRIFEIEAWGR